MNTRKKKEIEGKKEGWNTYREGKKKKARERKNRAKERG